MKSKIIILSVFALILSACSTGSFVTSSWVDDVYFTPGSVPPPVSISKSEQQAQDLKTKSADRIIISEIQNNDEGSKTMNNFIFDGQDAGSYADAQLYNLDQMELAQSDTTVYYDENEVKYVINNYYEGDDIDFGYRIRRFHRPFFHDPYYYDYYGWDSWYYPYSSWSYGWNWGWGGWGSSWYSPWYSWGYPYYGGYSPYYSYHGWGGYPYYYNSWYSPYYGGYWGNVSYVDREDYRYGQRRDFNTSAVYGNSGARRSGAAAFGNSQSPLKSAQPGMVGGGTSGRSGSISGVEGGGRPAREGAFSGASQNARTHTELRRDPTETTNTRSRYTSTSSVRSAGESPSGVDAGRNSVTGNASRQDPSSTTRYSNATQGTYTRPVSRAVRDQSGNTYTPSYNQQRTVNRSTYNVPSTERQSSSGNQGTTVKSAVTPSSSYTRPSSTRTTTTQTYRSTSTYNRSSSGVSSGSGRVAAPSGNYSSPSRSVAPSSSGSTYSSPSRSYSPSSSGSIGSGSSSSSGSSGSSGSRSSGSSSSSGRR